MFVAPLFLDGLATVEVCSEELAKCANGEIQRIFLDAEDWSELHFTTLARTQDGEHDAKRRYYGLSKLYDPKKVRKSEKEKKLEQAVTQVALMLKVSCL